MSKWGKFKEKMSDYNDNVDGEITKIIDYIMPKVMFILFLGLLAFGCFVIYAGLTGLTGRIKVEDHKKCNCCTVEKEKNNE